MEKNSNIVVQKKDIQIFKFKINHKTQAKREKKVKINKGNKT